MRPPRVSKSTKSRHKALQEVPKGAPNVLWRPWGILGALWAHRGASSEFQEEFQDQEFQEEEGQEEETFPRLHYSIAPN